MAELKQYPEPPNKKPSEFIIDLLDKFYEDVRLMLVEGDPNDALGVIQTIRKESFRFRETIQQAAPVFLPDPERGTGTDNSVGAELLPKDEKWLTRSTIGNEWPVKDVDIRAGG
jgi:hypothetical protein